MIQRLSYNLARELLKPSIRLVAITPGTAPEGSGGNHLGVFDSLDAAYEFFRRRRPEGRWTLWLAGSDGQMIGIRSDAFE